MLEKCVEIGGMKNEEFDVHALFYSGKSYTPTATSCDYNGKCKAHRAQRHRGSQSKAARLEAKYPNRCFLDGAAALATAFTQIEILGVAAWSVGLHQHLSALSALSDLLHLPHHRRASKSS